MMAGPAAAPRLKQACSQFMWLAEKRRDAKSFNPVSMAPEPNPWITAHNTKKAQAGVVAKPKTARVTAVLLTMSSRPVPSEASSRPAADPDNP